MLKKIAVALLIICFCSCVYAETATVFLQGGIVFGQTLRRLQCDVSSLQYNSHLRGESITDLVVIIISGGGHLIESIAIYEYLGMLKGEGMTIHAVASGICASGAMLVLQAGDVRYAGKYTGLMTHAPMVAFTPLSTTILTMEEIMELYDHMESTNKMMVKLHADRMGKKPTEIMQWFTSVPCFMTAEEAYQRGFIDRVIYDGVTFYNFYKRTDK